MLINGRFAIMGTLGELKKKFGEYTIAIQEIENGFSSMQIEILIQSILGKARRHNAPEEKGILFKYAKHVKNATEGCVTDED